MEYQTSHFLQSSTIIHDGMALHWGCRLLTQTTEDVKGKEMNPGGNIQTQTAR